MGLLQTIVKFDIGTDVMRLGDKLNEFDILVAKYEQMTGERISDKIKVAVISRVLIDPLKSQVLLTVPTLTYENLKRTVKEWALLKQTWTVKEVLPEAKGMEVDFAWKGKGGPPKGKGKFSFPKGGKGGQKGKSPQKGKGPIVYNSSAASSWRQPQYQPKGKGKFQFQGICNRCGKVGHKARDCYARVSAVQQEIRPIQGQVGHVEQIIGDEQVEYLMSLSAAQLRQKIISEIVLLLIDSGAFEHVCPKDFADWFPLTEVKEDLNVIAAGGHRLQMFGERTVRATTLDNGRARIKFKVMAVTRLVKATRLSLTRIRAS